MPGLVTRRSLLRIGAGAMAAGAYPTLLEPQWLEVSRTKVAVGSRDPIRILHLTDLHASWAVPGALIERAIALGLEQNPDLVCLTGDFITHRYDFDFGRYVRILKRLSHAKPVFAVLGNHDGGAWAKDRRGFADHAVVAQLLDFGGVNLLYNRAETVDIGGKRLTLVGLGDLWSGELDANRAFGAARRDGPVILLSHNPDSKDELARFDWDLMLSGHTHGGQVIIPFEGPRYAPVRDKRFVQGLHPWEGRQIYTSRGVGSIGSVRLACRPEVTILDLTA